MIFVTSEAGASSKEAVGVGRFEAGAAVEATEGEAVAVVAGAE